MSIPAGFFDPIDRPTLQETVVERLRQLIVTLALSPGDKIDERALCESLGVSRTPFRDAMRVLEAEGLVVITPRRGFRVATITERDLDEVFPIIGALEALAAELACERINEHGVAVLELLQGYMAKAHEAGDLEEYFRLNEQIHKTIREAAGNEALLAMLQSFSTRVRRARYMANLSPARWAEAVEEHEAMLTALKARDGARLGRLMKAHLANKQKALVEALREAGERPDAGLQGRARRGA